MTMLDSHQTLNFTDKLKTFHIEVEENALQGMQNLKSLLRKHALFHFLFLTLLFSEVYVLVSYTLSFPKSTTLALTIAFLLFTLFSYFLLHSYLQTKKPSQLEKIKTGFVNACNENAASYPPAEHYLALASATYRFSQMLGGESTKCYKLSAVLAPLQRALEGFSFSWHWRDFFNMQHLLLLDSVQQHIELIKQTPTDLEVHASLANTYIALSRLYTLEEYEKEGWQPPKAMQQALDIQFTGVAKRAVQEFHIMDHYSPNDPWVHAKLAACYHDLDMIDEEIGEYELILQLCPADKDVLFKLGLLYFEQGMNAKGLKIYEQLKSMQYSRYEELLFHYDTQFGSDL